MEIKPIKTRADHQKVLKEIESLMSAKANSPRAIGWKCWRRWWKRTSVQFPMELPDAVDAIKFRMEQAGLTVEDTEPVIGRRNRVYEVLSRRRPLTLRMIEGLHRKFGIPAQPSATVVSGAVPAVREALTIAAAVQKMSRWPGDARGSAPPSQSIGTGP